MSETTTKDQVATPGGMKGPTPSAAGPLVRLADAVGRAGEIGAKAANLAVIIEAGFPVPDGFVLPASTLEATFGKPDLRANVEGAEGGELTQWIRAALQDLGSGQVAVRSSGLAEDGADASYAGQYETELGLVGVEEVLAAVRRCWESAASERVAAYRGESRGDDPPRMAVIIQRLVAAEAAGVAFTANPITGAREEILVSAVKGLGEKLVSGAASPDEWVIEGETAKLRATGVEQAITPDTARAVARIARRLEGVFGSPQDVEWATAGGDVFVLQSRPITALPEPFMSAEQDDMVAEVPPGFWERDASHFPVPPTPMMQSLLLPRQNSAFRESFAEHGMLADGLEFRLIGGWVYARLLPPGGVDRPPLPTPLMWLLLRLLPALRKRTVVARQSYREDLTGEIIRRWYTETRPDLERRITELRDVDLEGLDDVSLVKHWRAVEDLLSAGVRAHFRLHAPIAMALYDLATVCRDLFGWDERRSIELLNGLSSMSTRPALELAQLGQLAQGRPAVMEAIERAGSESVSRLAEDPEFAAAFHRYQQEYAIRALRYEVADPVLAETPELTLATLLDQMHRGYDPGQQAKVLAARRATVVAEARRLLADEDEAGRARFERSLERAESAHPVREENEFFTVSVPLAVARIALLETGRRLAAREILEQPDDVFFLTNEEMLLALDSHRRGGRTESRLDAVSSRKAERVRAQRRPGPATYGHRQPPPPLGALTPETRRSLETVLWAVEMIFAVTSSGRRQSGEGGTIAGIPASPGRYQGRVRRVMAEEEFEKIRGGDVLVCPVTSPVWSVLFSRLGALVTDTGGMLSHPAIIAREFGIPAVVATGNATQLLRDGQVVIVDGDAGLVSVNG